MTFVELLRITARFTFLLFILTAIAIPSLSQGTQNISGTVKDQSGSAIPGATVTISETDTGGVRSFTTDASGAYAIPNLSVGTYTVEVKATGFTTSVRSGIVLHVGDQPVIDVQMNVGSMTQTVEVASAVPTIDTSNAVVGGVVENEQIENLPLNGRGFADLAVLQPGVVYASTGARSLSAGFGQKISISGMRVSSNDYTLDGQDIDNAYNDIGNPTGEAAGIDAVQEYEVVTNPFSADYGRTGAGLVQIVTKSGTNDFHGTAYEYFRNKVFNTRNHFDPASGPPAFERNQFGATLGGPIKKDRTFFFVNYEGLRQILGATTVLTVPDANAHLGIYTPTGLPVGVDPKVAPYLALAPTTGLYCPAIKGCSAGTALFNYVTATPTDTNYGLFRVDHKINSTLNLWGRYSFDSGRQLLPKDYVFTTVNLTASKYAAVGLDWTIAPTVINTFSTFYNRSVSALYDTGAQGSTPAEQALFALTPFRDANGISYMFYNAGPTTAVGGDGVRTDVWFNILQFKDDLTVLKGRHSLRFGIDAEHRQTNIFTSIYGGGDFAFNNVMTFLQDTPSTYSGLLPSTQPQDSDVQWVVGTYAQDDFKWNSKLTLNFGLRYEPDSVPTVAANKVAEFRGNNSSDPLYQHINLPVSAVSVGNPFYINPSRKNFAPRIGFAWAPMNNTVIRAGYGIFFDHLISYDWLTAIDQDAPIFQRGSLVAAQLPPGTKIDFPNTFTTQPTLLGSSALFTNGITFFPKQPMIQEFTLNVQRQFGSNKVFEIAYVGSQGRHLLRNDDWNVIRIPTLGPTGPQVVGQVPESEASSLFWGPSAPIRNTAFDWMKITTTDANSFYNGLTASFQQKYSGGLAYQVSYTYGHSTDDASDIVGAVDYTNGAIGPYRDAFLPAIDGRGLSSFDVRQALVMNVVYQVPWGRSKAVENKAEAFFISGWEVSGVGKIQGGSPFNVTGSLDSAQRDKIAAWPALSALPPELVGSSSPQEVHPQNPNNYFNLAAYTLPAPGTLGDLGRDQIIGPGLVDFDFSLQKEGRIASVGREGLRLQFRFDMFNAFNRANYSEPNGTLYTSGGACPAMPTAAANCIDGQSFPQNTAAGTIVSTVTPSRQLQFALKLLF
jgi:Carboxypeptidase regulatory-like domain/TonB-dependent Receptor Plug Domain